MDWCHTLHAPSLPNSPGGIKFLDVECFQVDGRKDILKLLSLQTISWAEQHDQSALILCYKELWYPCGRSAGQVNIVLGCLLEEKREPDTMPVLARGGMRTIVAHRESVFLNTTTRFTFRSCLSTMFWIVDLLCVTLSKLHLECGPDAAKKKYAFEGTIPQTGCQ